MVEFLIDGFDQKKKTLKEGGGAIVDIRRKQPVGNRLN